MAASTVSEAEFIRLWEQYGSCTELARILGVDTRNVQQRRRRLEQRMGSRLLSTSSRSPDAKITIPANGVRVRAEVESGVVVVASDAHYWPGIVSTAHRAFVKIIEEMKPKMVIMNGDAFDGAAISRHDPIGWQSTPSVKQELDAVQERLAEIENVSGNAKLHWTWGNHDLRFNTRLASQVGTAWEGVQGFNLQDHFPRWRLSTSVMINGHTMVKHRWHNGVHGTWQNVLKSGTSFVTGHCHALQVRPYTDYNGTRYAVDTGTLACPTGEQFTYSEDAPANHRSGFAVLTFYDGKLMPPELCEVVSEDAGLVYFRGEVIKV